jgi:curved DNA-binding protein CbpA
MRAMATDRDAYEVLQVHHKAHQVVLKAAHRALAGLYHPDLDQSASSTRRMAELNQAWEKLRTPDRREVYDRQRSQTAAAEQPARTAPTVITPEPPRGRPSRPGEAISGTLDFGRYRGWTLAQLAQQDPDYLRWLSRHSSGLRYRPEIERLLRAQSTPSPAPRRR